MYILCNEHRVASENNAMCIEIPALIIMLL